MHLRILAALLLVPAAALAQPHGSGRPRHEAASAAEHVPMSRHGGQHGADTPYAGFQARDIKALSDQQLADIRAGRGMALALPAELNGYPGPMHVLEHAQALALTPEQIEAMRRLMAGMRAEAIEAGERLIVAERNLDRLFADGRADVAALGEALTATARAQAALRQVHLATHIATRTILTSGQIEAYRRARGYQRN